MAKKPKKTTKKRVQAEAERPFELPTVKVAHEVDEDGWDDDGLTTRQRAFVEALVGPAGGNATKAAELAGYRSENRNALGVTASENLGKPNVQEAIGRALAKKKLTPEWAKDQLVDLCRASMSNFLKVDEKGIATLDFAKAAAMGAIGQIKEYYEEGIQTGDGEATIIKRKIKIHDRTSALGMLLKLHGLLNDKPDQSGADALIDPALARASPPPGAIPPLPQPGAVQDSSSGEAVGKDGTGQAATGDGALGEQDKPKSVG